MYELKMIRKIDNMIARLSEAELTQDQEYDLIDDLYALLDTARAPKHSITDSHANWANMFKTYMSKAKGASLKNLTEYTAFSKGLKVELIEYLSMAKHSLTATLSIRLRFTDILEKIRNGAKSDDAFPASLKQELSEINIAPQAFMGEFIPYIIASKDAVQIQVEISPEELEQLVFSCEDEITQATLLMNITEIGENDLRDFLNKGSISLDDVVTAIGRI